MHLTATWLRYPLLLAVLACLVGENFFGGGEGPRAGGQPKTAVPRFTLRSDSGQTFALHDLKGKKAVVIVFLSFECPVSAGYAPELAELARAFRDRGVAFVGVSVGDEQAAEVEKFTRDFQLPFSVYRDERGAAAGALRAEVTPEAFVLDADLVVRYRGRIDDRYAARLHPNARVERHDLRQALEEVLAGKPVSAPQTRAVGCAVPKRRLASASGGEVTYYRDVLPILQNHCQECHRPGEVGPFPLMTFRQAANWADDIKEYTRQRKMPPWKPVDSLPLHDERKLTEREIATLAAWADAGAPAGDPASAPPPRRFPEGWQLGTPDLVLTVEDDFMLGPAGSDLYRCFVLPTGLNEDRDVVAMEVRPGNRRVVHHAVPVVDCSRQGRKLEARGWRSQEKEDSGPGYSLPLGLSFLPGFVPDGALGHWTPGTVVRRLPEGAGFRLPRGSDIVLQVHYHRNGRVEKDRTSVGLYFTPRPAARRLQAMVVPAHFLFLPTAERYRVAGSAWVRQDCHIHAVMPHMHLLGREIKVTMTPPKGMPRTLVAIRDWDFYWQETYYFQEAVAVKAGTRFDVEGVYDNSARNPRNPNRPPETVYFGLETTDEMCLAGLLVTADQPGWWFRYDVQPRIQGLDWGPSWGIPLPGI
jgi:peroxiredoxin